MPDTIRTGGKTAKGYYQRQFKEAWDRYLTPQGVNEAKQRNKPTAVGTSGTFQNVTPKTAVTDEKSEKPPPNGHCNDVTVEKGVGAPCAHCGKPGGEIVPVSDSACGEVHLHRGCLDEWQSLEIPQYLNRRQSAA